MRAMTQQASVVVDWCKTVQPGLGIVPPCHTWRAGLGFRRAIVTAWSGDETAPADAEGITECGDRIALGAAPSVRAARALAEAWLYS